MIYTAIGCLTLLIVLVVGYRHQKLLKDRAMLMHAAIRHRDFSFRLPTKGLLFGERALQETLNDMGDEIEKLVAQNEVESWQRLARVLTHEIMNVMAPIQSISQAYLSDPDLKDSPYEEGLQAIHDTSTGLSLFISNYRKLTQLQEPRLTEVDLQNLFSSIATFFPDLEWEYNIPQGLKLKSDEGMLRQVIVNLAKNAVEADAKSIGINYERSSASSETFGRLLISNDGHVIPDELVREIFIPFFTTKSRGSGIGLSLSRQILLRLGLLLRLSEYPLNGYNVTFILEKDRS